MRMFDERDRRVSRDAALRRLGHEHAYLIIFGPVIAYLVAFVGIGIGAVWLWHRVSQLLLANVSAMLGALLLTVWVVWIVRNSGLRARMMARARGRRGPRLALVHGLAVSGALFFAFSIVVWRQG